MNTNDKTEQTRTRSAPDQPVSSHVQARALLHEFPDSSLQASVFAASAWSGAATWRQLVRVTAASARATCHRA